jgi:hypothetical protein
VCGWRGRHGEPDDGPPDPRVAVRQAGRYPEAILHIEEAIALCRARDDRVGYADALNSLGTCHSRMGRHYDGLAMCREAAAELQGAGYRWGEAQAWSSLGEICRAVGEHRDSVASYEQAVELFVEAGDRSNEADALTGLGDSYAFAGGHATALCRCWRVSLGRPVVHRRSRYSLGTAELRRRLHHVRMAYSRPSRRDGARPGRILLWIIAGIVLGVVVCCGSMLVAGAMPRMQDHGPRPSIDGVR